MSVLEFLMDVLDLFDYGAGIVPYVVGRILGVKVRVEPGHGKTGRSPKSGDLVVVAKNHRNKFVLLEQVGLFVSGRTVFKSPYKGYLDLDDYSYVD